jgi:hypothetical protein
MSRVIKATPGKISGVIMDNTTANKSDWSLLKLGHPDMFSQGLVYHGLRLFVKYIFAASKANRARDVSTIQMGIHSSTYSILSTNARKLLSSSIIITALSHR